MKLIHKFFLTFFITNVVLVGLMFVFIYMNFAIEFDRFVETAEKNHVAEVKQKLISFYEKNNSWQPITQDILLWRSLVKAETKPVTAQSNDKHNKQLTTQHKAPSLGWIDNPEGLLKTGKRISLYDKQKKAIVGRATMSDNTLIEPILLKNNIIGWLVLAPSLRVQNNPTKTFLTAQFENYIIFTLLVIVLAFVMAIILSRHLVKPIQQIVTGTNQLTKGNFSSRITPTTKDELGTLSKNFNELADTLEQNRQMRHQWMSDTSHELRTPLTVLRSHLLAIKEGVFVSDNERIDTLVNQVESLNHIVNDIAQLSYSDTGSLTYHEAKVDILSLLRKILGCYKVRFEKQALSFNSNALESSERHIVNGDKDRLQQLFVNLLENTCRYTDSGGQVSITVKNSDTHVELTFQDSEPGVLTEDQSKLFERFYRVEKSRNRELGGSGLGLALCKQIVEAHGGRIALNNSPLGGLAVKISLPLAG